MPLDTELQALAVGSNACLVCMSSQTYMLWKSNCNQPTGSWPLQAPGVNVLTVLSGGVLTAYKNNYLDLQWNKAAYVLFNQRACGQVVRASHQGLTPSAEVQAVVGAAVPSLPADAPRLP